MSSERIHIDLSRLSDTWAASVTGDELEEQRYTGDGPADVLEQVGQELDVREVARIRRERGI
jgi:hypothetical protein